MNKFPLGSWAFDSEAKEYVKISNLVCPVCLARGKNDPDHECGEHWEPCEAVALRVVSFDVNGPKIAYTYRGVKAKFLSPLKNHDDLNHLLKGDNKFFVGRV